MATKTTHIQGVRDDVYFTKHRMTAVTGIDEQSYCNHQEYIGLAYLEYRVGKFPELYKALELSAHYWNWWRLRWMEQDREVVQRLPVQSDSAVVKAARLTLWFQLHSIERLTDPDSADGYSRLLDASWCSMFTIFWQNHPDIGQRMNAKEAASALDKTLLTTGKVTENGIK